MTTRPKRTAAFALCGSFCSFSAVLPQMQVLTAAGGRAAAHCKHQRGSAGYPLRHCSSPAQTLYEATGHTPLTTLQAVEPLGPQRLAEALIIAPATGTTIAMLAAGISATPVTLAAKKSAARRAACHCCALYQRWPFRQRPGTGPAFAAAQLLFCALRSG